MASPNFMEKTFVGDSKTVKFVNVFSLKSLPLYGICAIIVTVIIINMYDATIMKYLVRPQPINFLLNRIVLN